MWLRSVTAGRKLTQRSRIAHVRNGRRISLANSGFIFSLWFALACTAHAQLFVPDTPIERDGRPAVPLPTPGVDVATPSQSSALHTTELLCPMIQSAAADNGLPVEFFARLIWQESRLMPHAVGPLTRSGGRAQGIAQFMPSTAAERLLLDPFDPVQALPKSAEFLRQLRAQFGNLGLAAAAYNAGPQRVQDWLAKKRTLPSETRAYVRTVTGRPADEWTRPEANVWAVTVPGDTPCVEAAKLAAKHAPTTTIVQQHRSIAAWAVQLVGDRSEINALASYNRLRKKHEAILGAYQPVVVRTTMGVSTAAIWHRVRIEANSRDVAETLCSRLRAAGGNCLVQRI